MIRKIKIFMKFDQANILAINAGDELKRMLGAPYNFMVPEMIPSFDSKRTNSYSSSNEPCLAR